MRSSFIGKVLRCVKENYRTIDELVEIYNKNYPPSLLTMFLPVDRRKFIEALKTLLKNDYIERDVARFVTESVDYVPDEQEYRLSNKGFAFLNAKKKRL